MDQSGSNFDFFFFFFFWIGPLRPGLNRIWKSIQRSLCWFGSLTYDLAAPANSQQAQRRARVQWRLGKCCCRCSGQRWPWPYVHERWPWTLPEKSQKSQKLVPLVVAKMMGKFRAMTVLTLCLPAGAVKDMEGQKDEIIRMFCVPSPKVVSDQRVLIG